MSRKRKITTSSVIGKTSSGRELSLLQLEKTESHVPDGSYKAFVRVLVFIPDTNIKDSFYFDTDSLKLSLNFLQTNEKNMGLLELYMMAIQNNENLNNFIVLVTDFMKSQYQLQDLLVT